MEARRIGALLVAGACLAAPGAAQYGLEELFVPDSSGDFGRGGAELVGAPLELAVDAGGTQQLSLSTCPPQVGALYLLLGSFSGTEPGIPLGRGLVLPLNYDRYFLETLIAPNQPPLTGSLGLLDLTGGATASFTLPPGIAPALAGLVAHHAFLVVDGAWTFASNAASLGFVSTRKTWTVDNDGPADFEQIAQAIASPLVSPGAVLQVHPGGYDDFTVTKPLSIVAAAGSSFDVFRATVSGVEEFTLAGMHAVWLTVEDVPGRGQIDDCTVGGLYLDDVGALYWQGTMTVDSCEQLLVSRSTLHGGDGCYPEVSYAAPAAVSVTASRVTFVDCELVGGNSNGADGACPDHYPSSGYALDVSGASEVTVAGSTLRGGKDFSIAPVYKPAIGVASSTLRVRGSSANLLWSQLPALPVEGSASTAVVSGVTLEPAQLPPWVVQPAEAEPWVRVSGSDALPLEKTIELYGPAGATTWILVGGEPALIPGLPGLDPLWLDVGSLAALVPIVTLGQDSAAQLALPAIPATVGQALIVQAWMPYSPTGLEYVTNAANAILRWQ